MKQFLFFIFLLTFLTSYSQTIIKGKVTTTENLPIDSASVYLNNTSFGTTTDENGEFELKAELGIYDIIVSHISYETIQYKIDTNNFSKQIHFQTIPKTNFLDEVVINSKNEKSKITEEDRLNFLSQFKLAFIGYSNFSKNCVIKNTDALNYNYDEKTGVLNVYCKEALRIINKDLGYECFYDLVEFELHTNKVSYSGHTRFKELEGSERKKRIWQQNRLKAYKGSTFHFFKAIKNYNLSSEGFIVDQFKRIPNPERPSEFEIEEAKKYIEFLEKKGVKMYLKKLTTKPKTKLDSALIIMDKIHLDKYENIVYKKNLKIEDFTEAVNDELYLNFDDYLYVRYMNEKEEERFRPGSNIRLDYQQSIIYLLTPKAKITEFGCLENPLEYMMEQYWAYEKFPNLLPLDYDPKQDF